MDNIIESIYKSCDETNTNLVAVSSLIAFIKPYMPNNLDELCNLQNKLDPDDKDPCIDYTHFRSIMKEWITNIQADDVNNTFSEFPNLYQTFGSNLSVVSCTNQLINNNTINDYSLQEQVETLKLQLNKATNELDLVKQQLAACEDQNDLLLAEISHGKHNCKQHCMNKSNKPLNQKDEICAEIAAENKKCEQLEKLLSNSEKQKQKYITQVSLLKNENFHLKEKLQFFERVKREDKKSLIEMTDSLDAKDTEIATLMEIINSLKSDVEKKTDLLDFYMNEHNLLKQKISDLENLLKNTSLQMNLSESIPKHCFNTPKLLNQIANPISPTLNTPVLKVHNTSSPIKNCSFESANGSSFDLLFNNTCRITMLRSPHKNLKDELAEFFDCSGNEIIAETDQTKRLQNQQKQIMKHQEDIKNCLWQNMKQLHKDNEILLDYKRECIEKEQHLQNLKNELLIHKEKRNDIILNLTKNLTVLEENLKQQKYIGLHLQKKLNAVGESLLQNKMKVNNKIMIHQSTETENCNVFSKKNNYTKQEMKIEKLLEKQERIEKDLNNERKINTKLILDCQEKFLFNKKIQNDLVDCRNKLLQQEMIIQTFKTQNDKLSKELELKKIDSNLEIKHLQHEINKLKYENQRLDENLRNMFSKLESETAINKKLCLDNDILLTKNYEMENKIKEDHLQQIYLKKQLIDTTAVNDFTIKQLQEELIDKNIEIRSLKKQIEIFDVTTFISVCNNELKNVIQQFCDVFDLKHDTPSKNVLILKNYENLNLENELILLNTNIAMMVLLLKNVQNKFVTSNELGDIFGSSSCNEDSFMSCSSDICCFAEDIADVILTECDEILENLDVENIDFKNLTKQEREEKFASLALLLSVDVTTLNKRVENEKEKFLKGIVNFFSYLNYSLNKTSNYDTNRDSVHLKFLQEISGDLFKTAVKYGILLYEKKTTNFWKLVINYVAILNQEKNIYNRKKNFNNLTIQTIPGFFLSDEQKHNIVTSCAYSLQKQFSRRKLVFWFYTLIILFFVVIGLIIYVDHMCPKSGKRLCPLEWLTNLFMKKIYSTNINL